MRFEGVKCDKCGATKGETNHWWYVTRTKSGILLFPADDGISSDRSRTQDACSQACTMYLVSEAMAELVKVPPNPPDPGGSASTG